MRASNHVSRRGVLGMGLGAASAAFLAACGGSSSSSSGSGSGSGSSSKGSGGTLKFWDMPWGATTAYNTAAQKLVASYRPAGGLPSASYQVIQWANFTETFAAAVASDTGPAVSTGGGFQAFQYAQQGAIAYADHLIETFKKNGTYSDFLPGQIEAMKTPAGYVAVPWQLDIRVWWYSKPIFSKLGLTPPTTWDELLSVGTTLARHGHYGLGTGAGAGDYLAQHVMVMMMINNGGGLFNADNKLDLVTPRNLEAMEFVQQLAKAKIIDPASVSYTTDDEYAQWKAGKYAMGINTAGLAAATGITNGDLALLPEPLTGPHGEKACLVFQNNIMMYKNTPSQADSEAFMDWYIKHMYLYWKQDLVVALPVLKSIVALPQYQQQAPLIAAAKNWLPYAKNYAAVGTVLSPALAKVDGSQQLTNFAQTMLAGGDPKTALQTLQSSLEPLFA
jgi:multiple sugar transport system substrate-binding protein